MNELTQEDIISLGYFCEALLLDDQFKRLTDMHNHQCFLNFANTTANQRNVREDAFASYAGVRDFVTMMTNLAVSMHELTDPEPQALSGDYADAL